MQTAQNVLLIVVASWAFLAILGALFVFWLLQCVRNWIGLDDDDDPWM